MRGGKRVRCLSLALSVSVLRIGRLPEGELPRRGKRGHPGVRPLGPRNDGGFRRLILLFGPGNYRYLVGGVDNRKAVGGWMAWFSYFAYLYVLSHILPSPSPLPPQNSFTSTTILRYIFSSGDTRVPTIDKSAKSVEYCSVVSQYFVDIFSPFHLDFASRK